MRLAHVRNQTNRNTTESHTHTPSANNHSNLARVLVVVVGGSVFFAFISSFIQFPLSDEYTICMLCICMCRYYHYEDLVFIVRVIPHAFAHCELSFAESLEMRYKFPPIFLSFSLPPSPSPALPLSLSLAHNF